MPAPWNPDEWIAMFDIWKPKDPINAGYIWLPLQFEKGKPCMHGQNHDATQQNKERIRALFQCFHDHLLKIFELNWCIKG